MTEVNNGLTDRIKLLVDAAGSQRRLAEILGKKGPTVLGWVHGSMPYDSNLQLIADKTVVALEWLRFGKGVAENEIEKFRNRLLRPSPTSSGRSPTPRMILGNDPGGGVGETPGNYFGGKGSSDLDPLSDETLARMIDETLKNETIPANVRIRHAQRYSAVLAKRKKP